MPTTGANGWLRDLGSLGAIVAMLAVIVLAPVEEHQAAGTVTAALPSVSNNADVADPGASGLGSSDLELRTPAPTPAPTAPANTPAANNVSSEVTENGSYLATLDVGGTVGFSTIGATVGVYSPSSRQVYFLSNQQGALGGTDAYLVALNGTQILRNVSLGKNVYVTSVALDGRSGDLYIAGYAANGSGTNLTSAYVVYVLHNETTISTIIDLANMTAYGKLVYNPSSDLVYEFNQRSPVVVAIHGTKEIGGVKDPLGPPFAGAFDPTTGDVYFTNRGALVVINGTSEVGAVTLNASWKPYGCLVSELEEVTYDPLLGVIAASVFCRDRNSTVLGFLAAVNASRVNGTGPDTFQSLPPGNVVGGLTFNPTNNLLYLSAYNGSFANAMLLEYNGSSLSRQSIPLLYRPGPAVSNPSSGALYVPNQGFGNVSVISTVLQVGALTLSPPGNPAGTADVGELLQVATVLLGIGSGGIRAAVATAPSGGLTCGSPIVATFSLSAAVYIPCRPASSGQLIIWMNLTDSIGGTVWTRSGVDVLGGIQAMATLSATNIDVGQSVIARGTATGGTGIFSYNWSGLPPGCQFAALTVNCQGLTASGGYSVRFSATDTNMNTGTSNAVQLIINKDPTVTAPALNHADVDTGTPLIGSVVAAAGAGGFRYAWNGVPPNCSSTNTALNCRPSIVGAYTIVVVVTDADGFSVVSPGVSLKVSPSMTVSVHASSSSTSPGVPIQFSAAASGGASPITLRWEFGDGTSSYGNVTSHPYASTGQYEVNLTASDAGGGSTVQSLKVSVVSSPTPPTMILGFSPLQLYLSLGLTLVVAMTAVAVLIRRRRRSHWPDPPK